MERYEEFFISHWHQNSIIHSFNLPKVNFTFNFYNHIGYEVVENLINRYWIPETKTEEKIAQYIEANFNDNFLIGFQIRTQFLPVNAVNKFLECANQLEKTISPNNKIKWFVSSDNEDIINEMKLKYGDKLLYGLGQIGHIVEKANSYERTVIDTVLLSKCDVLIMTEGSTFGFLASMMSGRLNYATNGHEECRQITMSRPGMRKEWNGKTSRDVSVI